ncbi:transketolase [Breznakia blatticola]|uniref:Transketolase n=1 Tax=Breznakia blatticola TaxID=1754012 RepID=A0A4R7ZAB9_9FIRM|nr:transketolase C-terminal domain-containing protein [Breznakia blatticola]TDW10204.1 transketolase [Breznakia blatticola]
MFTLDRDRQDKQEMRMSVVGALQEAIQENANVVALEADLGGASGWTNIQKTHPDNFINVGIAEANMIGIAAGLSVTGFVPFVHTFGPFATRRVFDQIFLSGAYAFNTLNIYGSDPGFCAGPNGGTHTTWEDVALMRTIPDAVICDAADDVQMDWIIKEFAKMEGIHYIRGNRKGVRNLYAKGSTFRLGKANLLREGEDVLLISAGQLVSDALDAANELASQDIDVEVLDMFTIKPLDVEAILKHSKDKKHIVVLENHSITGGLGSAVAEVIAEHALQIPLMRMGCKEAFGQVGSQEYLQKEFGLTKDDVVKTIQNLTI